MLEGGLSPMSSGSPWSPEEENVLWELVEPHIETIIKGNRGYKKLWEQVLINFRSHTNRLGEKFPPRSQRAIEQHWKLLYQQQWKRLYLQRTPLPVVEAVCLTSTATSSAPAPRTPPASPASFSASNPQSALPSTRPSTEPSTGPSAAPSATPSPVGAGVVKRIQEAECFFYGKPSDVVGLANRVVQLETDAGIVPQKGKINPRICAIEQWIRDAGS